MKRRNWIWIVFWMAVFVLPCSAGSAAQEGGACATCHGFLDGSLGKPVAEWKGSVHQQNGITCTLCHGGNADVELGDITDLSGEKFAEKKASAMSKSYGFVGKPSGKDQFDLCASCHSASVDRYAGSIMGQAYLEDRGGPSCVACHGAHDNVMPAVPESCAGCHKDTTGFSQIDPMNVTEATVNELARLRIRLAQEKTKGPRPPFAPPFPEELDSYQIGLLSFGAVLVLFLIGYLIHAILEKGR